MERGKNERKDQSKDEKIKACYERKFKKVGKKVVGRKEKRRKRRRKIEDATKEEYNPKKGERRNNICKYGAYSTQGTRKGSADRPPAIKYTKGNNNKHRSASTQQWCTVQTQLQRKYGASTSCCLSKEIGESMKCGIYCTRQKRGKIDNGISCK
jgi:hypothetical protein